VHLEVFIEQDACLKPGDNKWLIICLNVNPMVFLSVEMQVQILIVSQRKIDHMYVGLSLEKSFKEFYLG